MKRVNILMLLFICFAGCSVRQPKAQFISASITQSTPEAFSMDIEFEIFNTNDEPLQLMEYDYVVSANGTTVYTGLASAEQTIPRWSSITNTIPVVLRRDSVLGTDQVAWNLSGTLGYVPPKAFSETLLTSGIWKPSASIRAHGLVQVPAVD
jgi:hypothetical protein